MSSLLLSLMILDTAEYHQNALSFLSDVPHHHTQSPLNIRLYASNRCDSMRKHQQKQFYKKLDTFTVEIQ